MFKVVQILTVKLDGQPKTFQPGSIVRLPEAAAQKLIEQGKLEKIFEPVDDLAERMAIMGENCSPDDTRPRVENDVLVIPFASDSKYHWWWKGGMSPCDTLKELGRCDLLDKYRHISKN